MRIGENVKQKQVENTGIHKTVITIIFFISSCKMCHISNAYNDVFRQNITYCSVHQG